jgi:hypothetical protein
MNRFLRITCRCPDNPERKGRSNFLGSLNLQNPTIAHYHCKCCNTTWEYSVTDDGTVLRSKLADDIMFTDEIAIIDVE